MHYDLSAEKGGLLKEVGVEGDPSVRGTTRPLSRHRPHVDLFRFRSDALGPSIDLGLQNLCWHRLLKRFWSGRTLLAHGKAPLNIASSPFVCRTTSFTSAEMSAL